MNDKIVTALHQAVFQKRDTCQIDSSKTCGEAKKFLFEPCNTWHLRRTA
jgi:hypothetical protein